MEKEIKQKTKKVVPVLNNNLSTLWVDIFNVGYRGDDHLFIRLCSSLPDGIFEQARIMTSKERIKGLIDALCSTMEYYPTKTDKR